MIDHKNNHKQIRPATVDFPLDNKCCTSCVIYKTTINNEKNNYIRMTQENSKTVSLNINTHSKINLEVMQSFFLLMPGINKLTLILAPNGI